LPAGVWELLKDSLTVINLLLVLYIFRQTRKQQRTDRNEDRSFRDQQRAEAKAERIEQYNIEIGSFWIQRLILEPNRELIDEFFDRYEDLLKHVYERAVQAADVNQPPDVGETRKNIREFKTFYYRIRRRIIEPLCWVSKEFDNLRSIGRQIEDLVSTELARMPASLHGVDLPEQHEVPAARLATLRAEMVRAILEGQSGFAHVR
jgi:hypothetical protein